MTRWGLIGLAVSAHAATLSISIIKCRPDGLARATISWTSESTLVQVRANGDPMTGFSASPGSARTGDWVSDRMPFTLVDAAGVELARAEARVRCGADAASYFPLQIGNQWVYRTDSRFGTANYITWEVVRLEEVSGQDWFVVSSGQAEILYRTDASGRIYRRRDGAESVWLNPSDPAARRTVVSNSLGSFPDGLFSAHFEGIVHENASFVRGVGLLSSTSSLATGSSGGFLSSLDLVYARIGGTVIGGDGPSLELSIERRVLGVSARRVTNCAVPCYFTACGLVGATDPPGTFKPCFQTRVRSVDGGADEVAIELIDGAGRAVHRATQAIAGDREAIRFFQIPLYSAPNEPFPPGEYRVRAVAGEATATATLRIE